MTQDDQRPAPLVPHEVDLRDFGFMPLDVLRLRDSDLAALATGDEFKAAVLLWCVAWHQVPAASLPQDDRLLARFSGAGLAWKRLKAEALRGFVECSDGRLYHAVIAEKALESWRAKLAQRERTRAATEAREAKRRAALAQRDVPRDEQRDVERNDQREYIRDVHQGTGTGTGTVKGQGQGDSVVGAAAPPPSAARAAPTPRGNRLPADWVLPKPWGDWALTEYPQWTPEKVRREGASFRDHWAAKSGKDAAKLDWEATWRNWCRSDIAHRGDPRPSGRGPAAPQPDAAARNAEARRLLGFATQPTTTGATDA